MTGIVLWHVTASLDGFVTGPDDDMSWSAGYGGTSLAEETIASIGAGLAGRRGYDVAKAAGIDRPYGGAWDGPMFVLTHRPPAEPDPPFTFLTGDLAAAVATARAAAGTRDVVLFGADLARQCLAAGLVDEVLVHLVPVLLGDGVRLHDVPGGRTVRLERTYLGQSGQITDLRFRPVITGPP
ncbi:dihydrofolate reductase family protein [Pseudonocardia sp. CA-107938]|uniref:dihydrofolate reductase family protein n=1 Tax=Pseudonocardia sp. CA-107938 TaxID=3240021 RepID=UPI003D8AF7FE